MGFAVRTRRPPGPPSGGLFGQLHGFRESSIQFLEHTAREYGDVTYFRLGPQAMCLVNDPDAIRDILVTNQRQFVKSRALQRMKILLGEGLLTSEGEFHLRQRRLAQPAFQHERLPGYAATIANLSVRARERWRDGEAIDVSREMMRLTLAIVGATLFSAEVANEADEIGAALTAIFSQFHTLIRPGSHLLPWLPTREARDFRRARARLDRTVYSIIAGRRASGEDRGDLLSMLLLAQEENTSMTDRQVRDEAMTLFLAGHETTANALTWTFYLLSRNPACERRLHEEIDRVLGGRTPGFDDLPALAYTEMVLAESMRLYPPAWGIGRLATAPYQIGPWTIPAGSVLLMSQWVTHRDPRFWPDPERFDPERFLPEARAARPKFSYFPFGGGVRQCIGERFAWMEGALVLASIARKWRLRLVEGHRVEPQPVITLRPRYGMMMRLEAR